MTWHPLLHMQAQLAKSIQAWQIMKTVESNKGGFSLSYLSSRMGLPENTSEMFAPCILCECLGTPNSESSKSNCASPGNCRQQTEQESENRLRFMWGVDQAIASAGSSSINKQDPPHAFARTAVTSDLPSLLLLTIQSLRKKHRPITTDDERWVAPAWSCVPPGQTRFANSRELPRSKMVNILQIHTFTVDAPGFERQERKGPILALRSFLLSSDYTKVNPAASDVGGGGMNLSVIHRTVVQVPAHFQTAANSVQSESRRHLSIVESSRADRCLLARNSDNPRFFVTKHEQTKASSARGCMNRT